MKSIRLISTLKNKLHIRNTPMVGSAVQPFTPEIPGQLITCCFGSTIDDSG